MWRDLGTHREVAGTQGGSLRDMGDTEGQGGDTKGDPRTCRGHGGTQGTLRDLGGHRRGPGGDTGCSPGGTRGGTLSQGHQPPGVLSQEHGACGDITFSQCSQ